MLKLIKKLIPRPIRSLALKLFNHFLRSSDHYHEIYKRIAEVEHQLKGEMEIIQTKQSQCYSILTKECDVLPLPPKHLQIRVSGGYNQNFVDAGYVACENIDKTLKKVNKTLGDFSKILDFGCGCGRVLRAINNNYPKSTLFGSDVDPEAVNWLKKNFGDKVAEFSTNDPNPPTKYKDDSFDLIYLISVLTHLPEDMQYNWLEELKRISAPNGYLIITTHGENHYNKFGRKFAQKVKKEGFVYTDFGGNYGRDMGLPDFYQSAFHTHDYIRENWTRYFKIIDILPIALEDSQDIVLLQNI